MIQNTLMSIIENKLSFCKQFESADWNKKRKRSNIKFVMFRFLVFSNSRDISEILIQNILPKFPMVSWVTWFNRQQHQLSQMVTTLERGRDNLAPNKKVPPVPWKDLFTSKPFWVSKFARVIMYLVNYFNSNLTISHFSGNLV